jgi:hypothetical protein
MSRKCLFWGLLAICIGALESAAGAGWAATQRSGGDANDSMLAYRLIARATQRIERDRMEVRVYQSGQLLEMPRFDELVIVTPVEGPTAMDTLVRKSVALVRSERRSEEWDVYTNVVWRGPRDELTLPDNVFIIRKVVVASRKHPVEVRVDGALHRLKPGETLLVLG